MLEIIVQIKDDWNLETELFEIEHFTLHLEHSLISLSKWESKYEKAYLGPDTKTDEEVLGYVQCMITDDVYPEGILDKFTQPHIKAIEQYINAKMTATTVNDIRNGGRTNETITSELVYFWIVSYQIPWDVEHWHLNRLFTLIRLFSAKNAKDSKGNAANAQQIAQRNRALNEARRAELGTSG